MDVVETRLVVRKSDLRCKRLDGPPIGFGRQQGKTTLSMWTLLGSRSLQVGIQCPGHRIIQAGNALQCGHVRIVDCKLHLKWRTHSKAAVFQRRVAIHAKPRTALLEQTVVQGHFPKRIPNVPGELVNMDAAGLCGGLWRWLCAGLTRRMEPRGALLLHVHWVRLGALRSRRVDVHEVRRLYLAVDLWVVELACYGSVKTRLSGKFDW